MSLERQDVRFKLHHDMHAVLKVLADVEDQDICDFIELIVVKELTRRVHVATLVAQRTHGLGISGIGRESKGAQ